MVEEDQGAGRVGALPGLASRLERIESGRPAPAYGYNSHADGGGSAAGSSGFGSLGGLLGGRSRMLRSDDPSDDAAGGADGWAASGGTVSGGALAAATARWWPQSAPPEWLLALSARLAVPWAPSRQLGGWSVPPGVELEAAAAARGRVVAHTGIGSDTGTGRAFLWLVWNQGAAVMDAFFKPTPSSGPEGAAAAAESSGGDVESGRAEGARRRCCGAGAAGAADKERPSPPIDGVLATACEEMLLGREKLLGSYWRARRALDADGVRRVEEEDVPLVQHAIGSALLSNTAAQHSHLAHSLASLAACDAVPGSRYWWVGAARC
ncbi:hypothetical protein MNEG_16309 [Monoraphidium neglectum]|uniref:Uncharacterized protein n=1 Tax=Monoraphidium neglectum TaxID=145388 RepID=A0A0D2M8A3_9CHLO|nr:hypothetical protein MNEG_16309 [Monoraphidium neglectum]KIY91655.1 hypothetical protein MNEG_16309 [Monoraphidium neglectum]|eukprot:XP_013890675.1 hypothetical protein MNEG_16309 [Monoraphidium neglectum]